MSVGNLWIAAPGAYWKMMEPQRGSPWDNS